MQLSRPTIGAFLKENRRLIPREATALGSLARHPARHGKPVNQEEIAEVIGVTRVWYAMLESGAALHASPGLLARLADALSLSGDCRQELFSLGLSALSLRKGSLSVLKDLSTSLAPLRTATRRVLSATSELEVLTAVTEAIAEHFRDADFVGTFNRVRIGQWNYPAIIGGRRVRSTLALLHEELFDGLTPEQIDEVMLHGVLTEAGQVGTRRELHRNISVKHRIDSAFESAGFEGANFIDAHVKSREGFEATVFANYVTGNKQFSELDCSLLGTLADLASLALSRGVT